MVLNISFSPVMEFVLEINPNFLRVLLGRSVGVLMLRRVILRLRSVKPSCPTGSFIILKRMRLLGSISNIVLLFKPAMSTDCVNRIDIIGRLRDAA